MIEKVLQTAHYTSKMIVDECYNLRENGSTDSDEIDFLNGWEQLAGAYGILKDKGWNDNQIYKYLEGCKNTIIQERDINFESIKNLK